MLEPIEDELILTVVSEADTNPIKDIEAAEVPDDKKVQDVKFEYGYRMDASDTELSSVKDNKDVKAEPIDNSLKDDEFIPEN